MLKRLDAIRTPFDTTPIPGTVWRWIGLGIDVLGSAQIKLAGFLSLAAAQAYDARDGSGVLLPADQRTAPIGVLDVPCQGAAFVAAIFSDPAGANLSERLTAAVYTHVRTAVPDFADAEDVGL